MKVEIISATEKPVDVISIAAGTCYGKSDVSEKRVRHCLKSGHMSVFEHAFATFKVEGISRACMAQLTRHRLASFCVESQRYCKYDLGGYDWYVVPPELKEQDDLHSTFFFSMKDCAKAYADALEDGFKPEDARYLLPEATKTNLVMSCNLRELFHIFDMRLDSAAQWEVRRLAAAMHGKLGEVNDQWNVLMDMYRKGAE